MYTTRSKTANHFSSLDAPQPQYKFIYNVECPKGQPSLVRKGSGQVNDTADDIIPLSVVDRAKVNNQKKNQKDTHVKKVYQSSRVLRSFSSRMLQSATASSGLRLDSPSARDPSLPAKIAYDPPGPYVSRFRVTSKTVPV